MNEGKLLRSIASRESLGRTLVVLLCESTAKLTSAEKRARLSYINAACWSSWPGMGLHTSGFNTDEDHRTEFHIRYKGWRQIYVSLSTFEPENDVSDWPEESKQHLKNFCELLKTY